MKPLKDDEYVYCSTCEKMYLSGFKEEKHKGHKFKVHKGKLRTNSRIGMLRKFGLL